VFHPWLLPPFLVAANGRAMNSVVPAWFLSIGCGYAALGLIRGSSLPSAKVLQTLHQFRSTSAREHFPRAEHEEYHFWPYNRIEKEQTLLAPRPRLRLGSPYYIRLFIELGSLRKTFSEILQASCRPIRRKDYECDSRSSRGRAISSGPFRPEASPIAVRKRLQRQETWAAYFLRVALCPRRREPV
jgi:hypothetical protein